MEVMALPLTSFLSARSLLPSRGQPLIVASIRDDNFQLDFFSLCLSGESAGAE